MPVPLTMISLAARDEKWMLNSMHRMTMFECWNYRMMKLLGIDVRLVASDGLILWRVQSAG